MLNCTLTRIRANEFAFFHDQVTFNSAQRYQVICVFIGTLVIDSEADVSSLSHKFPPVENRTALVLPTYFVAYQNKYNTYLKIEFATSILYCSFFDPPAPIFMVSM
jgi:hypothetical protein